MDIKSTPLGSIYVRLTKEYEGRCPPGKELDDCELRANSAKGAMHLRVKTGERSFFGRAKARTAHQENAATIVRDLLPLVMLHRSGCSAERTWEMQGIVESYIREHKNRLTLRDLRNLSRRAVEILYPGDASARDSKRHGVPAAAAVPAALSLSSASASSSSTSWSARGGEFSRESLFLMQNSGANIISRRAAPASASSSLALDGYVRPELLLRDESSALTSSDFETQTEPASSSSAPASSAPSRLEARGAPSSATL